MERVMRESVKMHKISDVEVGSYLSSGVDSSYISLFREVDRRLQLVLTGTIQRDQRCEGVCRQHRCKE